MASNNFYLNAVLRYSSLAKLAAAILLAGIVSSESHYSTKDHLAFPKGTGIGLTVAFSFPIPTTTRLGAALELAHSINFLFSKLYPTSREKLSRNDEVEHHSNAIDDSSVAPSSNERYLTYRDFESLFKIIGMPGHSCLQRLICEIAEDPFLDSFGQMANTLFTPSKEEHRYDKSYEDYVQAEYYGREYGNCSPRYRSCPVSVFQIFNILNQFS